MKALRNVALWWRRMAIERKLPAVFAVIVAITALLCTAAGYREVKRSATEAAVARLDKVAREIAQLAGTQNTQFTERARQLADTMSAAGLAARLAADGTPTVVMDSTGHVIAQAGHALLPADETELQRAYEDAAAPAKDAKVVSHMYHVGDSIRYWSGTRVKLRGGGAAYLGQLKRMKLNEQSSKALQALIGESTVLIANRDDYTGPWVYLEGGPIAPPERPTSSADQVHYRAGRAYLARTVPIPGADWMVVTETETAAIRAKAIEFASRILLTALALTILGSIVVWLAVRHLLHPIGELAEAALAIGAGDLSRRVVVRQRGALGMLGTAFNRMAAEVERGQSELDARVRQRTAELQYVNEELESFSYSVSHDLRSPLRSIDGFSQALLEDYSPQLDGTAQDYLRRLRGGAQRMGSLIDDLLLLSRVARQPLVRKHVDVTAIAEEIVQELRAANSERSVEVEIAPGMEADADEGLLRVVLHNLLGNAWKFTTGREPGRIWMSPVEHEGESGFMVRDNGAGFDMNHSQHLFTPFHRLHTNREFEGTGIGLATVQRAVHRHGGRVTGNAELGAGATFIFTLGQG